ncbi:MAG: hypothetical protein AB1486_02210 [Planctomycetota bacterium]
MLDRSQKMMNVLLVRALVLLALALLVSVLFLPLLRGNRDESSAGAQAYREGRYQEALKAFTAAEKEAGNRASAELLYNRALAGLRAGELVVAEFSAEKAVARGGARFVATRDFVLGSTDFARCDMAEAEAARTDAGPAALDLAISYAEAARDSWQRAAMSRADWPEARRNVERALLKLEELKKKRAEAIERKKARDEKKKIIDQAGTGETGNGSEQEQKVAPQEGALLSDQVLALLDKLAEKEKEKLELRRAQRQARATAVEEDW